MSITLVRAMANMARTEGDPKTAPNDIASLRIRNVIFMALRKAWLAVGSPKPKQESGAFQTPDRALPSLFPVLPPSEI